MISARNITLRYGNRTVLEELDFSAKPGALTAIVGPNGSGKTTLLKALTGEVPFDGDVVVEGLNIATTPAWKLAMTRAVLPQSTSMSFPFQAIEVVRLGLQRSVSHDETLPQRALSKVGLDGYGSRFYQELSGGEQQRAQLARVLCQVWEPVLDGAPRWLFLDEPVSSLDIGHQLQVMTIARNYADAGGGVIAVMHDLNLSAMFADEIILMKAGRIISSGAADQALTNDTLSYAYGCPVQTRTVPQNTGWFFLPQGAGA
ncbi:heme ABC transporter ATP-binding protein [Roseobacter sp. EG26]|uniref:heme ABC transporter ATP-binding protein n=1 Tax=Roseobacter sp. EG26 TaxID=3412477 RepID=UPI003CE48954